MTPYLKPRAAAAIAWDHLEYMNGRLNQELYKYCSKRHEQYTCVRNAQKYLSPDAPASHHCIAAEALSQLTCYTFFDGISIPDAWEASYTHFEFAFYLIKVDPKDHKAPLLVDFYYHDKRKSHESILKLKHATCYTKRIFRKLKVHNYLAPQYLPLILQLANPCGRDGTRFILKPEHMVELGSEPVKAPTKFAEKTIRDLTVFQARRLRALLIRGRGRASGNLIVADYKVGCKKMTSMLWGQTKYADATYSQNILPTDATALWARIDRLGYLESSRQSRDLAELNGEEQENLVASLDRFIKLSLLNFDLEPSESYSLGGQVPARRKSPQQLLGFPCKQMGHAIKNSSHSPFTDSEQALATIGKALGNPACVAVVRLITSRHLCTAGELTAELPLSLSTVSQHLKELSTAGLIQGKSRGSRTRYRLNPTHWAQAQVLVGDLFGKVEITQHAKDGGTGAGSCAKDHLNHRCNCCAPW